MNFQPGQPFGRYRIESALGGGGMGSVYLAYDLRLKRRIALKTTLEAAGAGDLTIERFHREARAAASFRHPNLCKVYDVDEIDGIHYLTMEYIEGAHLLDLLGPGKPPLTPTRAAEIAIGAAQGLAEAHRLEVIHRDLKPANIMIDGQGVPVIVDFGLVRSESPDEAGLTRAGAFLGTRSYAAPEQWNPELGAIGPATDLYSLGVVLYEILAGRLPFQGPTSAMLMYQVLMEPPVPPSTFRPGLDPRLDDICLRALAKRPEDRHASMDEFASQLREFLADPQPRYGGFTPPPDQPGTTVEMFHPGPAPPPAAISPARLSRTVEEPQDMPIQPPKPPRDDWSSFPVDDRDRRPGRALRIAAVAGCLALLGLAAWLLLDRRTAIAPTPTEARTGDQPQTSPPVSGSDIGAERHVDPLLKTTVPPPDQPTPPTPLTPPTLAIPGRGWITTRMGDTLNEVHVSANPDSGLAPAIEGGREVELVKLSADGQRCLLNDLDGQELGWILKTYLTPTPPRGRK